ncbi:MAG: HEAT repeat domain-containing protein [Terriglobia bacterium]
MGSEVPFFPEQLIHGVLALSAGLFAASFLLIVYAIGRRIRHEQDFKLLDEFRRNLLAIFAALHGGALSYDAALEQVGALFCRRFQLRMEQIFLEHLKVPADHANVKKMAQDLGFVDHWRHCLGLELRDRARKRGARLRFHAARFFTRALNAENLGAIGHGGSWKLLSRSLLDPNADVQRVALRSLAAIGAPESFLVLAEHLQKTLAQPETKLSERDFLAALACFPLGLSGHLLPLLRHSNPKIRRLAAQILIQMTAAQEAESGGSHLEDAERGPEIAELILSQLAADRDAEIRARAAVLLARVRDDRAREQLRQLLNDEVWFVRLHAVRSIARQRDAGSLALLPASLTEAHWRVREAAAHSLARWGAAGINQLVRTFLSTHDAYAREQIAEELETSGELARMLARCAANGAGQEFEVLKEIVRMGKTGYLQSAMEARGRTSQRTAVLSTLAESSDPEVQEWANHMRVQ